MNKLVGQKIGNYEILELYGRGGMGSVYRARQIGLERDVAFKVVNYRAGADRLLAERFAREARISASLEHPNIVTVYDFGTIGDMAYVAMRLLTGGSLEERRLQLAPDRITITELIQLLDPLASALDYAHKRNIIHRDIKETNIMFDGANVPFLVDFGLARLMVDDIAITGSGAIVGTPSTMSPEQWQGRELTAASDQYSLGVVIYQLLTGRAPFVGDTPFALMHQHLYEEPEQIDLTDATIPSATAAVVARMLAKDPAERYKSLSEVVGELRASIDPNDTRKSGFLDIHVHHRPPSSSDPLMRMDDVFETYTPEIHQFATTPEIPFNPEITNGDTEILTVVSEKKRSFRLVWGGTVAFIVASVLIGGLLILAGRPSDPMLTTQRVASVVAVPGSSEILEQLEENVSVRLTGVSADGLWYRVELPDGRLGWVQVDATMRTRGLDDLVVVVPTESSTPTPVISPTGTQAPTPQAVAAVPEALATPRLMDQLATRADWVTDIVFNGDGTQLLTASTSGVLRQWDVATNATVSEMRNSGNSALTTAIHPSGLTAAVGYIDGTINIWLLGRDEPFLSVDSGGGAVYSVAYHPDGALLAAATADGRISIWSLSEGLERISELEGHAGAVLDIAYSPDGTRIVSGGVDGTVRLWNTSTGDEVVIAGRHDGVVWDVTFSPEGEFFASGSEDASVKLFDPQGVELETFYGHEQPVYAVAFSPDSSIVATAGADSTIQIYDVLTGILLRSIVDYDQAILSVAFSPNYRDIAFGGLGERDGQWGMGIVSGLGEAPE
jgi:WD40 repeat protein/serine/threonine protein kinase